MRLSKFYLFATVTVTLFLLLWFLATASQAEEINLEIIKQIESSGNPRAVNPRSGCIGLYQINPKGALADYNAYHSTPYSKEQLFDPDINEHIANWYLHERIPSMLRYYKMPINLENIISSWNWGIGNTVKWNKKGAKFNELPNETKKFILRYKKMSSL